MSTLHTDIRSLFSGNLWLKNIGTADAQVDTLHVRLQQQQQQQQQHSLFAQASWGRLEMKPERNKFKVQAH